MTVSFLYETYYECNQSHNNGGGKQEWANSAHVNNQYKVYPRKM